MTRMSDLPRDMLGEILSRVPLTCLKTVRSTCKNWYDLFQNQIFGKTAARNHFLGFMTIDYRVLSELGQVTIDNFFHCDGLLLFVIKNDTRLLVWNPYLGQRRWIQTRLNSSSIQAGNNSKTMTFQGCRIQTTRDKYTLGYDKNNHSHKILRFSVSYDSNKDRKNLNILFEIYDFNSESWKVLDVTLDWDIWSHKCDFVSLKGNTYFLSEKKIKDGVVVDMFLLCFDFTTETFGRRLPLPSYSYSDDSYFVTLSCVRDEQLTVLYQPYEKSEIEFWITTKIEPNMVSWSKFLKVNMTPLNGLPDDIENNFDFWNFIIDKEKKLVVVSEYSEITECCCQKACIIGEDGYFEYVNLKETLHLGRLDEHSCYPRFMLSSYVPSLVQLQIKQQGKRKERD